MSALIVAVGPTLTDGDLSTVEGVRFVPPVRAGDLIGLVCEHNPTAIGIVDGFFGDRPAIGHKEILWTIAQSVAVYGAASMGALRAAELDVYGMIGVGRVYEDYRTGRATDDADVALLHGPTDYGYKPLTVPLVDIRATLASLVARDRLSRAAAEGIERAAAAIYFSERTWTRVAAEAAPDPLVARTLFQELAGAHVQRKRLDALEMVDLMVSDAGRPRSDPRPFPPPMTPSLRAALRAVEG